ncbi:MAG: hypothetical protein ACKOA8_07045 [Deltaproteobacteria bacterium]
MRSIFVFFLCFSLIAFSDNQKKSIADHWNCLNLFQKVGVGAGGVLAITVGLMVIGSTQDKKKKTLPKFRTAQIPELAQIKLSDIENDRDLFSRVSDLTDYWLTKYGEDPKLKKALQKFIEESPIEAKTALRTRFPSQYQKNPKPDELFTELGSRAYYPLIFAWYLREVYNLSEVDKQKTLREITLQMERNLE